MKSPKVYVRDSGLVHALLGIGDKEALLAHPVRGASWECPGSSICRPRRGGSERALHRAGGGRKSTSCCACPASASGRSKCSAALRRASRRLPPRMRRPVARSPVRGLPGRRDFSAVAEVKAIPLAELRACWRGASMTGDLRPYPAMKDSGVTWLGQVPEHWEVQRLGNLSEMDRNVDKHCR